MLAIGAHAGHPPAVAWAPMTRFDTTHWSVVLGAAEGDDVARESFCRTYGRIIRAYLCARWRVRFDHDQVSEGVQEVFLECFKDRGALERVDPARPFRAFLYGVTAKTALALERRRARNARDGPRGDVDLDRVEKDDATLSQVFDREWARMVGGEARALFVERAGSDGARFRRARCLELRYQKGLPPRDIAKELDVTVERVYEMLHQAKSEYRAALLDVMASHHPGATRSDLERICGELAGHL